MAVRPLLLALSALVVAFSADGSSISTERVDLYQGDQNVVHLDNVTFYDALLDKPHAWAIEFYKDWCGHCRRFAPIWSEVARRARNWGTVIRLGAVNCARRRNSAICRANGVRGVPTVRLFRPRVSRGQQGQSIIRHDPDKMVGTLVDFVTGIQQQEQQQGWPEFSEYSGSVTRLMWGPEPLQALILEKPGLSMGRAVQLELSSHQRKVRISRTSHLPVDLTSRPASLPAMVLVHSNGSQELITAGSEEDPKVLFSSTLRHIISAGDDAALVPTTARPTAAPVSTPAPTRAPADTVFMVDMENAIVVSLKQEVTSHTVIEGEALEALRGFLRILLDLFPGRRHLMDSLHQLLRSVTGPERVSGEALERLMKSSSPWWPGLPELQPYQACRGSRPKYRGYSCGLWTLFHTLTVQEFKNKPEGQRANVLPVVHGYVKNFFSCRHCSMHFQEMAAEDGLFNVHSTYDSLVWLWRAHNKVNKRIARDPTEDPLHPKRQFPDTKLCPECFNGAEYVTYNVVQFLLDFYSADDIRGEGLDVIPVANLPSRDGHASLDATGEAAGQPTSVADVQNPSPSHRKVPSPVSPESHLITQQRVTPVRTHSPSHRVESGSAQESVSGPPRAINQRGLSSVLTSGSPRTPHLVRSSLPPPAVLPPLPGRPAVVPGIMRYPSEMAHVFPTVVRAAPAEDAEVQPGLDPGFSRTQQRVVHTRPRVVYSKPRIVYTRPRIVYTRPRAVFSESGGSLPMNYQHSMVHPVRDEAQHLRESSGIIGQGAMIPSRNIQRSTHSVRTYWMHGNP